MVKMQESSKMFLEKNIPEALKCQTVHGVLDLLYDFIENNGFAAPDYEDYNDIGSAAQKVYDDVYLSNCD